MAVNYAYVKVQVQLLVYRKQWLNHCFPNLGFIQFIKLEGLNSQVHLSNNTCTSNTKWII